MSEWNDVKEAKEETINKFVSSREDLEDLLEDYTQKVADRVSKETADEVRNEMLTAVANGELESSSSDKFNDYHKRLYETLALDSADSRKESKKILKEASTISESDVPIYNNFSSTTKQPDSARRQSQRVSYLRSMKDPIVGSIPDTYTRWVVGRGINYDFADNRVQKVADDFWEENSMDVKLKKYYWRFIVESELFTTLFVDRKRGRVRIREIPPREVTDIEINSDDKEDRYSYKREFVDNSNNPDTKVYPDINYYDGDNKLSGSGGSDYEGSPDWEGPNKLVHFIKLMNNREVRGRVFFERFLNWAEWFKDWVIDRAIINHEKGRVVWILTLKGRAQNNWEKFTSAPAGGTVKIQTQNKEWEPVSADIRGDNVQDDGLFLLYQICAGSALPLHILTQRTDQQVYSSIRKSETSFSMSIMDKRHSLAEEYLKPIFKKVIEVGINSDRYNIPRQIDITQYVSEGIRSDFKETMDNYKNDELDYDEFIRKVKNLVESSKRDIKDGNYTPSSRKKMLREAESIENACNSGMSDLIESNFEEEPDNIIDIMKSSYRFFEEGIKTRIDTKDCPVSIEFPDLIKEDFLNMAKVLKIYDQNNIASKRTIRKKAGLDPEQEELLIKREKLEDN